jgi:hypothetical protein
MRRAEPNIVGKGKLSLGSLYDLCSGFAAATIFLPTRGMNLNRKLMADRDEIFIRP